MGASSSLCGSVRRGGSVGLVLEHQPHRKGDASGPFRPQAVFGRQLTVNVTVPAYVPAFVVVGALMVRTPW